MGFALSPMGVSSPAFGPGGPVPKVHTGFGENLSPPLQWAGAPDGARSFALFCVDPDAPIVSPNGTFGIVHWVLYNIPGDVTELEAGVDRFTSGPNQTGGEGYIGPKPPPGHGPHHYYFCVLALGADPDLPAGLTLTELLARVEPDVLAMNRLVGTFVAPEASA